ncbi:MAG: restriction endonuclease subunit S [Bacteroidetes bacterium]|nr:restriction endonuclease subunit S [Bacteroidota bacterium]
MKVTATILKNICHLITDGKHGDCQNQDGSDYYFISAKDVADWKISYENARQITQADFEDTHRRTRFEPLDIVIVSTGANIGDMAIAKDEEKTYRTTFQKSVAILKPDKSKVNPHYLAYFICNSRTLLHNISSGSAQKNLLLKDLRNIKINLPDISIQNTIASTLKAYDDLIENNLQRIKLLEETAQITFNEWFGKVGDLPKGWERKKLTEIADFLNGYAFKPNDLKKEGFPVIKIKELKGGINNETPRNSGQNIPSKYLVVTGDILFSWSASLEIVQWQHEKGILNQHLFKVIPKEGISKALLFLSLKNALPIFNNLTTGATMKHIKRKELDFVQVVIPTKKIMHEFDQMVLPVLELSLNLNHQNRLLKEARDILLPRLMNGTISVEKAEARVIPFSVTYFPRVVSGITATDLHAGIISMVINIHQNNPKHKDNLSHVKCEKISDLVERKLGISLGRVAVKDAAGPDDFNHLKKVEHRATMAGYFRNVALPIGHTYEPLRNIQKAIDKVKTVLTEAELSAIEKMLQEFLPFNLEHSELVATIYAGWNNLLLLDKKPTDEEIVFESRENWSKRKLGIPKENFFKTLEWMKRHDYIPEGKGQLVLKKEEVEVPQKAKRKSKKKK